jgi:GNAT superfamily N-acetyltransferase
MISIRNYKEEDKAFVISTWLKSFYTNMPSYKVNSRYYIKPESNEFYKFHSKVVQSVLEKPLTTVLIACNEEDENQIFGYIIYDENCMHWLYVKQVYRRNGIGTRLLKEADFFDCKIATHLSNDFGYFSKLFSQIKYNPYILLEQHEREV